MSLHIGVRFAKMFLIIDLGTFLTVFDFGDFRAFPETASPFPASPVHDFRAFPETASPFPAFPGNGFGYYT